jgi:cutinase-like protein
MSGKLKSHIVGLLGAVMLTPLAVLSAPVPSASAQPSATAPPCPDVEVVFARGTYEPPGVGLTGQAFVDALRSQIGARSLGVYAVNYPASGEFGDRIQFARTVVDGIRDAGTHVESMAATCPNTKMVLGGYSQGAVVAGFVTAAAVPEAVPAEFRSYVPNPMPDEVADHVAAVALFGMPSDEFMRDIGAPPIVIGPRYVDKVIRLCVPDDTICNGAPAGLPSFGHGTYTVNGTAGEAAAFTAGRL